MRIVMISPGGRNGRGGMASVVRHLADGLPKQIARADVQILDTYGPGPFWAMPLHFANAFGHLLGACLCRRADVVHIHMACHGSAVRKGMLAFVSSACGVPTIVHLHGGDLDEYIRALPPARRRMLVAVLHRCAKVVVIGQRWYDFVVNELALAPERVALVHNGVPLSDMPVAPERRSSNAEPRILMLGALAPLKGSSELVAALATPELRRRDWKAVLAGNGQVDELREVVRALGLGDRIRIPGWQTAEEVDDLLAHADVLVLASHEEGLPMAILEGMAHGVAVVTTPVGAITDAVTDEDTGLLVPPGDVPALAAALARVIDDSDLRARLGAAARARVARSFTIDRAVAAVASIYREVGVA